MYEAALRLAGRLTRRDRGTGAAREARVTATVYAGITEDGRERAAAKMVDAGFGR